MSSGDRSPLADRWPLDPGVCFLNHGSFGACPTEVLEYQQTLRQRAEREPVRFMVEELPALLDNARAELASFLGASPARLVFVTNATEGVNAVLGSFPLREGDEVLTTDHEYNACRNALNAATKQAGARVAIARVPFPIDTPSRVTEAILGAVTGRTRLAMISHITSPTALIFPIAQIVKELRARGVATLVDGAHAPGMVPMALDDLNADYYTGNCHKWMCAPKGAAFLYVGSDAPHPVRPAVISHGYNAPPDDRPPLHRLFDWPGTRDFTAFLTIPEAIRVVGSMRPGGGGWDEVRRTNHELAMAAQDIICRALSCAPPAPEEMIGSMCSFPIPSTGAPGPSGRPYRDALQLAMLRGHSVQAPVSYWPKFPARLVRVSAQQYNARPQYERFASALVAELGREPRR